MEIANRVIGWFELTIADWHQEIATSIINKVNFRQITNLKHNLVPAFLNKRSCPYLNKRSQVNA